MKHTLTFILALMFFGCSSSGTKRVTAKFFSAKDGLCTFYYERGFAPSQSFEDSCHLYHIGDSIKFE